MNESIRTPLGKVRGLGSAKHGAGHFIAQRVTAIANLFLVPWLLISLIYVSRGGYQGAVDFIASPINAVLILATLGSVLYHMRIGMQVVIEDYIARTGTRLFLLLLNTLIVAALFTAALFAVLEVST